MKIVNEASIILIKSIIQKYSSKPGYYCNSYNYVSSEEISNLDLIFLPNVMTWDPLNNIKPPPQLRCPHCFDDRQKIIELEETSQWTDCQTNSLIPRTIWDKDWFCLLVGKIYICSNHHRIVSYHAGILCQLPPSEIPFVLTHDSGLNITLFDFIMRMVECGTSFQSIQNVIRDNVLDVYMRRKLKHCKTFPLVQNTYETLGPSVGTIINCVTSHYRIYRQSYEKQFNEILFNSLSFDHTYKVAANIGYEKNGKWVKLYDSLFIALNENGLTKAYQLTKGTSFGQLDDLFKSLAVGNPSPEYLFVDNCCSVKNQLNLRFPNVAIKLDLFHAVQRLTKHISNKHPFFSDAVKEIGLVFRQCEDIGKERTKATPSSNKEIEDNLDRYILKWTDVCYNGWKIFNEKVSNEFRKIRVHILNGCLSGIPVGMGTNKNEALHKSLKQFGRCRLSVETARAVIAYVLYATNYKRKGNKLAPPIWSQYDQAECNVTLTECKESNPPQLNNDFHLSTEKTTLSRTLASTDHSYYKESEFSKIIGLASTLSSINGFIPKELKEKLFRYQGFTTLASEFWDNKQFFEKARRNKLFPLELIQSVREKMGFVLTQTDGTFFSAFLHMLENLLQTAVELPPELITFIRTIVVSEEAIEKLKTYFVNEFEGQRKDVLFYRSFDLNDLADTSNYENSEFVLQLFTAASNIFNLPVIVVPVSCGLPMLPLFPVGQVVNHPVFMVFDPVKNTFDAYLNVVKKNHTEKNICYCGQKSNAKASNLNCFQNFRCACIKNKVECSSQCKCTRCGNNKSTTDMPQPAHKRRKRIPHMLSRIEKTTSLQYLLSSDIPLANNLPISSFNHFILEANLFFLMKEMALHSILDIDLSLLTNKLSQKYSDFCDDSKVQVGYEVELFRSCEQLSNASIEKWLKYRKKKSVLMVELTKS